MARNENQGPTDGITPHLTIRDGKAHEAIDFYRRAFGAETAIDNRSVAYPAVLEADRAAADGRVELAC